MNRIYVSRPQKRQRPATEILCPTGSDLTASELQIIQELLTSQFRTRRLYKGSNARQQAAVSFPH